MQGSQEIKVDCEQGFRRPADGITQKMTRPVNVPANPDGHRIATSEVPTCPQKVLISIVMIEHLLMLIMRKSPVLPGVIADVHRRIR